MMTSRASQDYVRVFLAAYTVALETLLCQENYNSTYTNDCSGFNTMTVA